APTLAPLRTMVSCTSAVSRTPTATIGSRSGWTPRSPAASSRSSTSPPEPRQKERNMPVNPNAAIEITAFRWVPEFAQGVVRDLRVRWAIEEAGLDYRVRLLDQERPLEYLREQPFDQVPCFSDGEVRIFETGAIVQYLGERSEVLLPYDRQGKYRA